jgi:hypothetical protein
MIYTDQHELLTDYNFNCGLKHFNYDPNHAATLTYTEPGYINLVTNSNYGSIVPNKANFPAADYRLYIKVKNVSGNGEIGVKNSNNTWFNIAYFDTDGVYTADYSGDITTIRVGASNDTSFSADFDFISLRLQSSPGPSDVLVDDMGEVLEDDSGEVLTAYYE